MSMAIIIPMVITISALVIVIIGILLGALVLSNGRLVDMNKQLMLLVAGKEAKPEALRALVASNKPPQGKLKGIAGKKDKKKKHPNTDYTLTIGENNGV